MQLQGRMLFPGRKMEDVHGREGKRVGSKGASEGLVTFVSWSGCWLKGVLSW